MAAPGQGIEQGGLDPGGPDGAAGAFDDGAVECRGRPPGQVVAAGQMGQPAGVEFDPTAEGRGAGNGDVGPRFQTPKQVAEADHVALDDGMLDQRDPHRERRAPVARALAVLGGRDRRRGQGEGRERKE